MNEVLYQLYCVSGKPRYLELASLFDPSWFLEPLVRNEDILSGLHANTHIVLVNGFARRYESTGRNVTGSPLRTFEYAHAFPCVCQRHKQRSAPERHDRDFVDGRALGRTLPSVQYFDQRHCGELRDP